MSSKMSGRNAGGPAKGRRPVKGKKADVEAAPPSPPPSVEEEVVPEESKEDQVTDNQ
jgi:hypothetical protein